MTNKEIYNLHFEAWDYQKISDIVNSIDFESLKTINGLNNKSDTERKSGLSRLLIAALTKIDKLIENDEIYIGRGKERKSEKISMFLKPDEPQHGNDSKINGVIGSVKIVLRESELENIGCVFYGKPDVCVNLRIRSRCDDISFQNTTGKRTKSYFAATLLTYGEVDKINNEVFCNDDNLYDFLLIDVFAKKMSAACFKGRYKTYRRFENNDDRIKGSIDVSRHIRQNAGLNNGKIAYHFKENTINNYLNILIAKTYLYVKKKYPEIVRRKIEENVWIKGFLDGLLSEADPLSFSKRTIIMKNLKPVTHPYFKEYDDVRKICLRLLRDEGVSIFAGEKEESGGFLYYLPDLWEEYLKRVFLHSIQSNELYDYSITEQSRLKIIESSIVPNEYLVLAKPDFVVEKSNKPKLILDAKMKLLWDKFDEYGKMPEDDKKTIRADIDECIRNMVVFATEGTGVIYPRKRTKMAFSEPEEIVKEYAEGFKERSISEKCKQFFVALPFMVPVSSEYKNYSEWKHDFEISRKFFCEQFIKLIQS